MTRYVEEAAIDLHEYLGAEILKPAARIEDGAKLGSATYYFEVAHRICRMCIEFREDAVEPLADMLELIEQHGLARPRPTR